MDQKLVFGLDLGLNNVGWAALRIGQGEVNILSAGTYVFSSPLQDTNDPGEGLKTKVRGMKRRGRRTSLRRHNRKQELYRLLADHGYIPTSPKERAELFCRNKEANGGQRIDPYALRVAALDRKLAPFELGRALCHLNQRRGFISPRDVMLWGVTKVALGTEDSDDAETSSMLKEISQTRDAIQDKRTLGEFLKSRLDAGEPIRKRKLKLPRGSAEGAVTPAKQKSEDLRRFVRADRRMMEQEFDAIMNAQRPFHSLLTEEFIQRAKDIIFFQRLLATDASTRGLCTFFPKELRAPRASLLGQKFVLAQSIANLRVRENSVDEFRALSAAERKGLIAKLMTADKISWTEAKQACGLPNFAQFETEPEPAGKGSKRSMAGKTEGLKGCRTAHQIRQIIGAKWDALPFEAQNDLVGEIVSIRDWVHDQKGKTRHQLGVPAAKRRLDLFSRKAYGPSQVTFSEVEAAALATANLPEGYLMLSRKAIRKILPGLLRGLDYSQACEAIGLDHAQPGGPQTIVTQLPYPSEREIPNRVVLCSVQSAVRVLNELAKEYGPPDSINIELPRDLAMGGKAREAQELKIRDREKDRRSIAKELESIGIPPNGGNIKKVLLWRELGGNALPYEPSVHITDLQDLIYGDYQIDHIVPRSHNADSSLANLTLATGPKNLLKANKTPYEAFSGDGDAWEHIKKHVSNLKSMPIWKRQRILAKERPDDFSGRHLAATGYISQEVLKLTQRMVTNIHDALVTPGTSTSVLRRFWGLENIIPLHPVEQKEVDEYKAYLKAVEEGDHEFKTPPAPNRKTRSNYKHHTLDAIVVALASRSTLQRVTEFFQLAEGGGLRAKERQEKATIRLSYSPDPQLRNKVEAAIEQAVIVHRPNRRIDGQLHNEQSERVVRQPDIEGQPMSWKIMDKAGKSDKGSVGLGKPNSSGVVGKHLVRFDSEGHPVQAYPLSSNHHVVIWESLSPNKKGVYEREAEVVSTIEAARRKKANEPVVSKNRAHAGWKFVMSLCKGDMVEMEDGRHARIAAFTASADFGIDMRLLPPYVAALIGDKGPTDPYILMRLRSRTHLQKIVKRAVFTPSGKVAFREGLLG